MLKLFVLFIAEAWQAWQEIREARREHAAAMRRFDREKVPEPHASNFRRQLRRFGLRWTLAARVALACGTFCLFVAQTTNVTA